MKLGHIIALLGAAMALVGGLAEGFWQTFEMSGISASGLEVMPAGQIVVGLAGLTALCALLGLLTRHAKKAAKAATAMNSGRWNPSPARSAPMVPLRGTMPSSVKNPQTPLQGFQ